VTSVQKNILFVFLETLRSLGSLSRFSRNLPTHAESAFKRMKPKPWEIPLLFSSPTQEGSSWRNLSTGSTFGKTQEKSTSPGSTSKTVSRKEEAWAIQSPMETPLKIRSTSEKKGTQGIISQGGKASHRGFANTTPATSRLLTRRKQKGE